MDTTHAPIAYPREAILTITDVALWLRKGVRSIERMDIPCYYASRRDRRYIAGDVLDWLRTRTEP